MRSKVVNEKFDQLDQELKADFDAVAVDIDRTNDRINTWVDNHKNLSKSFTNLATVLANNGVIRDLRRLEKRVDELEAENESLKTNGVATAINKLNEEVFKESKDKPTGIFSATMLSAYGLERDQEPTLAGKVDAIIAHLGLNVEVQPKQVVPAKTVAKKTKKGKK